MKEAHFKDIHTMRTSYQRNLTLQYLHYGLFNRKGGTCSFDTKLVPKIYDMFSLFSLVSDVEIRFKGFVVSINSSARKVKCSKLFYSLKKEYTSKT
jgi:hypothetical protein